MPAEVNTEWSPSAPADVSLEAEQHRLSVLLDAWNVGRIRGFHATPAAAAFLGCLRELLGEQQGYLAVAEQGGNPC